MRCAVVGAGAWGTALADLLARNEHEVSLWAYEADVVESINAKHENVRFLRGYQLSPEVKAVGEMITLNTMRFAHEIVDPGELNLPQKPEISKKEMELAHTLINSMADKFDAEKYKDTYYDKVMEVIQMKIQGVSPQAPAAKPKGPAKVVDLMEVLKQSLKETQKKGTSTRAPEPEAETTRPRKVR